MIKILTKLVFSSGAIAGTVFAGKPLLVEPSLPKEISEEATKALTTITKFADIDIYAKQKGCSFAFVRGWKDKTVYNAEEFVRLEKSQATETEWEVEALKWAEHYKDSCKKGTTIVLAYSQSQKRFNLQFAA